MSVGRGRAGQRDRSRGGAGGIGRLELMGLEHPMTAIRNNKQILKGPYNSRPMGPKPVKIRAEQEDSRNAE